MRSALIIPSFRRPADLARCLEACRSRQIQPFGEVIIVARREDEQTGELVQSVISADGETRARLVTVEVPGVIAAMQAGLDSVSADVEIICLTDDDTAPRADWLEQIVRHFEAEPALAGVGGRDWQWRDGKVNDQSRRVVGIVQWFGRIIGNHHLGVGDARDVDVLKGANCAFRADLLRRVGFDHRLLGSGAQMHWEMSLCLELRREGWRLIYDPALAVDHYLAKRVDVDTNHRGRFHGPSLTEAVHNETMVLLEHLSVLGKVAFGLWATLVGTGENPGIVQMMRALLRRQSNIAARWRAAQYGRFAGWKSHRDGLKEDRRRSMTVAAPIAEAGQLK